MPTPAPARIQSTPDATNIQIRNVPEALQKQLKARAALEGVSMSDMLIRELTLIVNRKSNAEILRTLEAQAPVRVPAGEVARLIRSMRGEL
jgi:antitoxin FitA